MARRRAVYQWSRDAVPPVGYVDWRGWVWVKARDVAHAEIDRATVRDTLHAILLRDVERTAAETVRGSLEEVMLSDRVDVDGAIETVSIKATDYLVDHGYVVER